MGDYHSRYLEIELDRPASDSELAEVAAMCKRVGLKPPRDGISVHDLQEFRSAIGVRIARGGCKR